MPLLKMILKLMLLPGAVFRPPPITNGRKHRSFMACIFMLCLVPFVTAVVPTRKEHAKLFKSREMQSSLKEELNNIIESTGFPERILRFKELGDGHEGFALKVYYKGREPTVIKIFREKSAYDNEKAAYDIIDKGREEHADHPGADNVLKRIREYENVKCQEVGYYILELEYAGERNLLTWISGTGIWRNITMDDKIDFLKQLCRGMLYLRKIGLVHRDIKSTNIMVSSEKRVRIMDFGMSHANEGAMALKCSGTASHMAPEVLFSAGHKKHKTRNAEETFAVDTFSLANVILEVVSRKSFFGYGRRKCDLRTGQFVTVVDHAQEKMQEFFEIRRPRFSESKLTDKRIREKIKNDLITRLHMKTITEKQIFLVEVASYLLRWDAVHRGQIDVVLRTFEHHFPTTKPTHRPVGSKSKRTPEVRTTGLGGQAERTQQLHTVTACTPVEETRRTGAVPLSPSAADPQPNGAVSSHPLADREIPGQWKRWERVEVYSNRYEKWLPGHITKIFDQNNREKLAVLYDGDYGTKNIFGSSEHVRSRSECANCACDALLSLAPEELYKCSCKEATYCSDYCQRDDYVSHSRVCTWKPSFRRRLTETLPITIFFSTVSALILVLGIFLLHRFWLSKRISSVVLPETAVELDLESEV